MDPLYASSFHENFNMHHLYSQQFGKIEIYPTWKRKRLSVSYAYLANLLYSYKNFRTPPTHQHFITYITQAFFPLSLLTLKKQFMSCSLNLMKFL